MRKCINLKNNKKYVTDDNWKTFKQISVDDREKNRDVITEVKLRDKLGEKYSSFIINELRKIKKKYKLNDNEGYGEAFEIFAMSVLSRHVYDYVYNNNIVKGSLDGGIDAIEFSENKVQLYQFKIDYSQIEYSKIKPKMRRSYLEYLDNDRNLNNPELSDLNDFLRKHDNEIKENARIILTTVCSGEGSDLKPEDVYNKFLEQTFINTSKGISLTMRYKAKEGCACLENNKAYVFFMSADKFLDYLLNTEGIDGKIENLNKYFCDNVRGKLKDNDDMGKTISSEAENFVLYNNGITITGLVKKDNDDNLITIKNPVISNGQQTIWNIIKHKDSPNISKVKLLIIIKSTETNSNVKNYISKYTNSQTNIKEIDLLSLEPNIRNIQEQIIKSTSGNKRYFLNINTSGKKGFEAKIKKCIGSENVIELKEFVRLYFCDDFSIGSWKNQLSTMIKKVKNVVKDNGFDLNKSLCVCSVISEYNTNYRNLSKDEKAVVSTCGVSLKYLMVKFKIDFMTAYSYIREFNNGHEYSELMDIYKNNNKMNDLVKIVDEGVKCKC